MKFRNNCSLLLILALLTAILSAGCAAGTPEDSDVTTQGTTEATTAETIGKTGEENRVSKSIVSQQITASDDTAANQEIEVPEDAQYNLMSADTAVEDYVIKGDAYPPEDPLRPWYNLGSCEQMEGNILFICIFMEDNESEWTETERSDFLNGKCFPALEWLVGQADYYEAELTCTLAYYNDTVKYEGVYGDFNNGVNPLILQDAALALGYTSEEEMQQDLFYQYDVEQVAFIVAMDKPGRCYASIDTYNDNYIRMEHAVLFDDTAYFDGLYYSCDVSTVAHELLHLFGAEDYYSEGTDRNGRAALAESWFYHDVMLRTYSDVSYNSVGPVTAYSVGWRDISHVVLTDEQWWN